IADTSARYANLAMSRLRHVRLAGADFRGGVLADMKTELVEVSRCDFTEADFSHTRLAGLDFRDSAIDGIAVNLSDLRGATVSTWQAAALIRILGVRVED
ncbi:MAG: pentapeptide repeat-containing protein, partial [Alistipes sp.]|nr:pentapeptide repeat-containing protein [Alistipes sp.]